MAKGDIYAPDFPKTAIWLNTQKPLSLTALKGQVILLDFWTYCCINCLHVLPDLKYLETKYRHDPFLVIGVHAAKFDNEKNQDNIEAAVQRYDINHPVVIDDGHVIWEAYGIQAWPSLVLIDSQGRIRGVVEGENWRLRLDVAIGQLLEEGRKEKTLAKKPLQVVAKPASESTTLLFPGKIALDISGEHLYVSDSGNNRVLTCQFKASDRVQITDIYDSFNQPQGLCVVDDYLYVCDTGNHLIKRIDLINKKIMTIAGTGEKAGLTEPKGEGLETALNSPWDLDYTEGYLYIAMAGAHQIWSLHLEDNLVEVFAGSGLEGLEDGDLFSAQLAQPSGLSISQTKIYFVDSEASAVRQIDLQNDEVETLIGRGLFDFGNQDGSFSTALLQHPLGIFASENSIYLADTYNNALKELNLATREVRTLLGKQQTSGLCRINDQACDLLPLWEPSDVVKHDDNVYIADTNNHLIRNYNLKNLTLSDVHIERFTGLLRPSGPELKALA